MHLFSMFLFLIIKIFATTTYYDFPSDLDVFLQPYLNENSTHVLSTTSSIGRIDDYNYMFIARCYKNCAQQVFYYSLRYDSDFCDFDIYMTVLSEYSKLNIFLSVNDFKEILKNNYNYCPSYKKIVSNYNDFLQYIKEKRYKVINNYYFIIETYVLGSTIESNDLLVIKHNNNGYPKYMSNEQAQIMYNNVLYNIGLNDNYPGKSQYKVLSIGKPLDSTIIDDSSNEVVPEKKIYILYNCSNINNVIDIILPDDQSFYGTYNERFAIKPKILKYNKGIQTNDLWYYINENNIFEVVSDYTSIINKGDFSQKGKYDYLLSLLDNMNCKYSSDKCSNSCTKDETGYYVKIDVTSNFMIGLSDYYRIKVTNNHAFSINDYYYTSNGKTLTLINIIDNNIKYTFSIGSIIPKNDSLFTAQYHGRTVKWIGSPK